MAVLQCICRVILWLWLCVDLGYVSGVEQTWETCAEPRMALFSRCECGYNNNKKLTGLRCVNSGYTNANVVSQIPFDELVGTLSNVTFTGNNFNELPVNLFGVCSHSSGKTMQHSYLGMDHLDLSNNNINVIHGKTFHCIQNVRVLILDDNNLDNPANSPRMFSDLEALEVLHLKNAFNFDKQASGEQVVVALAAIFENSKLDLLQEIHLESNYIGTFSPDLFVKLQNLGVLNLADNYLTDPVISSDCRSGEYDLWNGCPLTEVYLNSNSMSHLSAGFMKSIDEMNKLQKLDISDNPYWCDCDFVDTLSWLKNFKNHNGRQLLNSFRLVCNGPPKVAGREVLTLSVDELQQCVEEFTDAAESDDTSGGYSSGAVAVIVLLVLVLCALVGVLYIKNRKVKEKVKQYFPRLFSHASGYDMVSNQAATV